MSKTIDVKQEITEYLRELQLPAIRSCFEEKARQAERENQPGNEIDRNEIAIF